MEPMNLIVPSEQEAALAKRMSQILSSSFKGKPLASIRLSVGIDSQMVELPAVAVRLLIGALDQMAKGNAVTLMPIQAELTTQQAADLLNVSRPYLVGLLDKGEIPHHKVGTHRRILAQDVFAYQRLVAQERDEILEELVALNQQLGFE
jgi:excisionase family DNA binding protein